MEGGQTVTGLVIQPRGNTYSLLMLPTVKMKSCVSLCGQNSSVGFSGEERCRIVVLKKLRGLSLTTAWLRVHSWRAGKSQSISGHVRGGCGSVDAAETYGTRKILNVLVMKLKSTRMTALRFFDLLFWWLWWFVCVFILLQCLWGVYWPSTFIIVPSSIV